MLKRATPTGSARLNLNPGAQLRGWPLAQTNGHRRWNGGKKWTTHTVSQWRTDATISSAALGAGDVTLAAKQVQVLMAQPGIPAASDLMWAGQVAVAQSDPVLALDYAERVLADKRADSYKIASAATLVLSLTSPPSQRYAEAWKRIEDVARDPKNPASLGTLVLLANEQANAAHTRNRRGTHRFRSQSPSSRTISNTCVGGSRRSARDYSSQAAVCTPGASAAAGEGGSPPPGISPGLHTSINTCNTVLSMPFTLDLGSHFAGNFSQTDDEPEGSG